MNTMNALLGVPETVHLDSTELITGLTLTDFTVSAFSDTSNVSSSLTITVSEISATHYVASVSFPEAGNYFISFTYGSYTEKYQVGVEREDTALLALRSGSSESDYEITVEDDESAIISGATVRVFNSTETKLLTKGTTNTSGKVTFALPVGTYKVRASKSGYSFTSINPTTIVVTATDTVNPVIEEFVPESVSASDILCIKGLHFSSNTVAFLDGTEVALSSISKDGKVVLVNIPADAADSISVQLGNPDSANPGSHLKSKLYNLLVTA